MSPTVVVRLLLKGFALMMLYMTLNAMVGVLSSLVLMLNHVDAFPVITTLGSAAITFLLAGLVWRKSNALAFDENGTASSHLTPEGLGRAVLAAVSIFFVLGAIRLLPPYAHNAYAYLDQRTAPTVFEVIPRVLALVVVLSVLRINLNTRKVIAYPRLETDEE